MERVIVTGANGFIGRNLINEMLKRNIQVVALDLQFDDELINSKDIVCIDVMDKDMYYIEKKLNQYSYDCFFHFAFSSAVIIFTL